MSYQQLKGVRKMTNLDYYESMIEPNDYEPRAIKHVWDDMNKYFSVLVHDDKGNYPDVWIDVCIDESCAVGLDFDWNMWMFRKDNAHEQKVKVFQDLVCLWDGWLWHLCIESVERYLLANNLIKENYDYTYEYVEQI